MPERTPRVSPAPPAARPIDLALALGCAALGVWTYRRVLGSFFSPDDFIYLERALGILPPHRGLWRVLSGRLYFEALTPLFGARPLPWLATNLALHGLVTALLFGWIRRAGGSRPAATLGAGLYAASRLHLTTLAQVATVSEPLAAAFTLLALWAALVPGWRAALTSAACFAAALLSKETVVALPLVLLAPRLGGAPAGLRVRRAALLLALGLGWTVRLALSGERQVFAGGAYDAAYGANVFHDLMTYADWSLDFQRPSPDQFGTFSATAWRAGVPFLAALVALAFLTRRRTPLTILGAAWWLLALMPVLPLLYHSYLHYLYLPSLGLAMALAGALDAIRAPANAKRERDGVAAWAIALVLVTAHAAMCASLLEARARERLQDLDLPLDPFLRKIEMARRGRDGVAKAVGGGARRIALVMPQGEDKPFGDLFLDITNRGRAFRVLFPALDTVAVVDSAAAAGPGFARLRVAPDGRITDLGAAAGAR